MVAMVAFLLISLGTQLVFGLIVGLSLHRLRADHIWLQTALDSTQKATSEVTSEAWGRLDAALTEVRGHIDRLEQKQAQLDQAHGHMRTLAAQFRARE